MSDTDDGNADRSREPRSQPVKISRFSKFEGIIVGRERIFDVLATIITAIFTVVLALSTVFLWKETKDLRNFAQQQSEDMKASIAQASRSANAMRDVAKALSEQTEMAHENLRAYLTVDFGAAIKQNKDTNFRYEVRMTIQNVGATLASDVRSNTYADVLPFPLPADFKFSEFNRAISSPTTLGPHQSMFISGIVPRIYSDDDVNEIENGTKKLLYVYGTVTYKDVFGVSRYSKFCRIIFWGKDGSQISRNTPDYNDAN